MSIEGNLLDVSVAEVMQFVHLGGRSGTLTIEASPRRAEVGFHRGRIISAWTPDSRRLGDLLVDAGVLSEAELTAALFRQQRELPRQSLGKLLVAMELVDTQRLRQVVADQIERTIYDLVAWREGRFRFALDELRPIDDIAVYPGDILPDINLNTQMVVLEALRIFDERNRDAGERVVTGECVAAPPESAVEPEGADEADLEELLRETEPVEGAPRAAGWRHRASPEARPSPCLQLVSDDADLARELAARLDGGLGRLAEIRLWDAGLTLPGEAPPVVIVDLRSPEVDLEELANLRRARAHASIVAIADGAAAAAAYEAGALAVLPPDPAAVAACVASVVGNWRNRGGLAAELEEVASGFAKLRRVVADLRSGLLSATVALNLMKVISESVERAIMFVVRGRKLVALGAFGVARDGRPLAASTHGFEINLARPSALTHAVNDGHARSLRFEEADLPQSLAELIGRPRTGQVVIFPVLGSERVNSVVYTDNGEVSREIEEIEILELAVAQVGVAFENELLRRRMEATPEPAARSAG